MLVCWAARHSWSGRRWIERRSHRLFELASSTTRSIGRGRHSRSAPKKTPNHRLGNSRSATRVTTGRHDRRNRYPANPSMWRGVTPRRGRCVSARRRHRRRDARACRRGVRKKTAWRGSGGHQPPERPDTLRDVGHRPAKRDGTFGRHRIDSIARAKLGGWLGTRRNHPTRRHPCSEPAGRAVVGTKWPSRQRCTLIPSAARPPPPTT